MHHGDPVSLYLMPLVLCHYFQAIDTLTHFPEKKKGPVEEDKLTLHPARTMQTQQAPPPRAAAPVYSPSRYNDPVHTTASSGQFNTIARKPAPIAERAKQEPSVLFDGVNSDQSNVCGCVVIQLP